MTDGAARKRGRVLLLMAALVTAAMPAFGQVGGASTVVDPEPGAAAAHSPTPAIAFEVISIKRNMTAADEASIQSPPDSDGVTVRNLALEWIIDFAYDFERPDLVSGLPEWTKTEKYDIVAKVADTDVAAFHKTNFADRRLMLQAVLVDRFQLKARRVPKEMPIYALTVAKNGPKMKQATPGDTYANGVKLPNGASAGAGALIPTGMGRITGQGVEMSALVVMLSRLKPGREVVDKTGLTGRYDFTLRFAPEAGSIPVINGQAASVSAEDAALPSIFTAVQEQLGLKLEATKGQVDGLVIDHVERPADN